MRESIFQVEKGKVGFLAIACILIGCLGDPSTEVTYGEQLQKDKQSIDAYLASKNITGTSTDPDNYGIRYKITTLGQGIKPILDDSIKVNYTIKLLPTEIVAENPSSSKSLLLAKQIPAWQIGLPLMNENSKATFYVPSGLAYGRVAQSSVPANSNLIIEIELLKVISQLAKDTVAIDSYLSSKSITAKKDPSGIRYVITTAATGAVPNVESTVTFNYVAKVMNTEAIFDQSLVPIKYKLGNLIKGLRIGFQLIKVGTKVTFYIPSTLAYGYFGADNGRIPSRANLIYEIEFISIE
jgi:FKBP-type peptidyl-prolyl cis-trans isomerase